MELRNVSPLGALELPLIGRVLEPGETFEVPDDVAAALLEQVGNYEPVAKPKPRRNRTTSEENPR